MLENIINRCRGPNYERCTQLLHVLQLFKDVVDSCFGHGLMPGWQDNLERFQTAYLGLQENVTLKLHCVFEHVETICLRTGRGLSLDCEQAIETLHSDLTDLEKRWKHYKVKFPRTKLWAKQLLRCILEYNALNCI